MLCYETTAVHYFTLHFTCHEIVALNKNKFTPGHYLEQQVNNQVERDLTQSTASGDLGGAQILEYFALLGHFR